MISGTGRKNNPLLKPIPAEQVFQIVGVDIMELPKTSKGNQNVVDCCISGFPVKMAICISHQRSESNYISKVTSSGSSPSDQYP